jgi:hypothetical protein
MANQQGQYTPASPSSIGEIHAHGDVKTKVGVLWFVGIICGLLIIGNFLVLFIRPENAKDVWVITGPILSAAISGTLGFLAGRAQDRRAD